MQKILSFSLLYKDFKIKIYRTIIPPVVLYGCETRSLTMREEHSLKLFKNSMLKRTVKCKRGEVTVRGEE